MTSIYAGNTHHHVTLDRNSSLKRVKDTRDQSWGDLGPRHATQPCGETEGVVCVSHQRCTEPQRGTQPAWVCTCLRASASSSVKWVQQFL